GTCFGIAFSLISGLACGASMAAFAARHEDSDEWPVERLQRRASDRHCDGNAPVRRSAFLPRRGLSTSSSKSSCESGGCAQFLICAGYRASPHPVSSSPCRPCRFQLLLACAEPFVAAGGPALEPPGSRPRASSRAWSSSRRRPSRRPLLRGTFVISGTES